MANVAVIAGSSRGLGLAFSRYLLQNSNLQVVATTSSKDTSSARDKILENVKDNHDNLTMLDMDITNEDAVHKAAKTVQDRFGKNSLRLLINVAGVLKPEKSIGKLDYDELLTTFKINTFGHALAFKHFTPLLPTKSAKLDYSDDPAKGIIASNLSVLASMTARIGSIADNNNLGGWYSYRASKAATNQFVKTLNLELQRASTIGGSSSGKSENNAIAIALHPGTLLGTDLSKPFVDPEKAPKDAEKKEGKTGVHSPEVGAEKLMDVLKSLDKSKGGKFFAYDGTEIPW